MPFRGCRSIRAITTTGRSHTINLFKVSSHFNTFKILGKNTIILWGKNEIMLARGISSPPKNYI